MNPEQVFDLARQLMQDGEQLDSLAQTIPGKIQQIEEAAQGLHAAVVAPENLNQINQALHQIHESLQSQQSYLQQVAQKMQDLMNF